MGNWARIHQRLGKNSNEVTKTGILTNGDYKKKMANLGEKGKKWAKMESSMGLLTNDNFIKITNLAKNL